MIIIQIVYVTIFGRHNIIIGIILGLAAVSFINRDFTGQIVYRTITFLIVNIYLGTAAYFAATNIYRTDYKLYYYIYGYLCIYE
ncbi:hypothetical protein ACQQ2T_04790 [Paraclostridium tenue]